MAGVFLAPMRVWALFGKRSSDLKRQSPLLRLIDFALGMAFAISIGTAWKTMPVVFRCLGESECAANRAGALVNLSLFGFVVVVLEMSWQARRSVLAAENPNIGVHTARINRSTPAGGIGANCSRLPAQLDALAT